MIIRLPLGFKINSQSDIGTFLNGLREAYMRTKACASMHNYRHTYYLAQYIEKYGANGSANGGVSSVVWAVSDSNYFASSLNAATTIANRADQAAARGNGKISR